MSKPHVSVTAKPKFTKFGNFRNIGSAQADVAVDRPNGGHTIEFLVDGAWQTGWELSAKFNRSERQCVELAKMADWPQRYTLWRKVEQKYFEKSLQALYGCVFIALGFRPADDSSQSSVNKSS
jgi:hypothetical protein